MPGILLIRVIDSDLKMRAWGFHMPTGLYNVTNTGINSLKNVFVIIALFTTSTGLVRGDPNIYGPGGINLGPNGELPPRTEEIEKDKLFDEERKQNQLLLEQVEQLQNQIQQLQLQVKQLQRFEDMRWDRQYPVNIQINSGYPQSDGWIWGGPYWGVGGGGITLSTNPRGGGGHHGGGKGGGGTHHGGGGGRGGGGGHR